MLPMLELHTIAVKTARNITMYLVNLRNNLRKCYAINTCISTFINVVIYMIYIHYVQKKGRHVLYGILLTAFLLYSSFQSIDVTSVTRFCKLFPEYKHSWTIFHKKIQFFQHQNKFGELSK